MENLRFEGGERGQKRETFEEKLEDDLRLSFMGDSYPFVRDIKVIELHSKAGHELQVNLFLDGEEKPLSILGIPYDTTEAFASVRGFLELERERRESPKN